MDILDRRGRLVRIALSLAIGLVVTLLVFAGMNSVMTREVNPDPMSQMGVIVVVSAIFVGVTRLALAILTAVSRRKSRRVV